MIRERASSDQLNWKGLEPRCGSCRAELRERQAAAKSGDLVFHARCAPTCSVCEQMLDARTHGWRLEGEVVSEPWGWSVRPTRFWCRDCLESVPRDRPVGLG